jgi:hypothetical protein
MHPSALFDVTTHYGDKECFLRVSSATSGHTWYCTMQTLEQWPHPVCSAEMGPPEPRHSSTMQVTMCQYVAAASLFGVREAHGFASERQSCSSPIGTASGHIEYSLRLPAKYSLGQVQRLKRGPGSTTWTRPNALGLLHPSYNVHPGSLVPCKYHSWSLSPD